VPALQVYLGVFLLYFSEAYREHGVLLLIAGCSLGGLINCRLIVALTCKIEISGFAMDTTLFLLVSTIIYAYSVINLYISALLCVGMFSYMTYYIYSISVEIASCLGLSILTVKKKA